jgi:UDP-3-O-[3-hydroxymyristoyl] N-acetylglucosamine deacetylase
MARQRTLKHSVSAIGIGLHSGENISVTLHSAPVNTGIVFRRTDLSPPVEIPARCDSVGDTTMCTTLVSGDVKIGTVEHLLSAFAGMEVDNAYVDIDSFEVPIMDGSSSPFVFLIQSSGIIEQNELRKFIRIKETIKIEDGDRWVKFSPFDGFKVGFSIDFDHPVIKQSQEKVELDFAVSSYVREVSRARTFGFMRDIEYLQDNDLAKGASDKNAIALNDEDIVNEDGLRSSDEFVKHKILDAVGDVYLLGHQIIGHFEGHKSGHGLNNLLLRKMLDNPDTWEYVEQREGSWSKL